MKKARREKREADHLIDAGNTEMGVGGTSSKNSKLSNSNVRRRKHATSMDFSGDKKLG